MRTKSYLVAAAVLVALAASTAYAGSQIAPASPNRYTPVLVPSPQINQSVSCQQAQVVFDFPFWPLNQESRYRARFEALGGTYGGRVWLDVSPQHETLINIPPGAVGQMYTLDVTVPRPSPDVKEGIRLGMESACQEHPAQTGDMPFILWAVNVFAAQ